MYILPLTILKIIAETLFLLLWKCNQWIKCYFGHLTILFSAHNQWINQTSLSYYLIQKHRQKHSFNYQAFLYFFLFFWRKKLFNSLTIRSLHSRMNLVLGFEAYLVGGCVRDLLLNRVPKDFDVITSADLTEVVLSFSFDIHVILWLSHNQRFISNKYCLCCRLGRIFIVLWLLEGDSPFVECM